LKIAACKGMTIAEAQKKPALCDIALRLSAFAAFLEESGRPCSTIVDDVQRRIETLTDTVSYPIAHGPTQWLGDPKAPVSVVMYVSMSCPACKHLYGHLYDSLVRDPELAKIMRLGVAYFTDTRIDLALAAAAQMGKQPDFLRALAEVNERLTPKIVERVAESLGISARELWRRADDPATARMVAQSRAEAAHNGVEVTPTFFINNRRYRSFKSARWVIDAVRYLSGTAGRWPTANLRLKTGPGELNGKDDFR